MVDPMLLLPLTGRTSSLVMEQNQVLPSGYGRFTEGGYCKPSRYVRTYHLVLTTYHAINSLTCMTMHGQFFIEIPSLSFVQGFNRPINKIVVTPDGSRVIGGGYEGTIRIWSLSTGACLFALQVQYPKSAILILPSWAPASPHYELIIPLPYCRLKLPV